MIEPSAVQSVFVYGTLQRGQCRERLWPRAPLKVEPAWTLGALYDLGPYPALVAGSDRILGEAWHFAAADLPPTLDILDGIEGHRGAADDLYVRVAIECVFESGRRIPAHAYRYARTENLRPLQRIRPDESGYCRWP